MQTEYFLYGTERYFTRFTAAAVTNEQLYQKISDTLTLLATGGDRQ